MLGTLVVATLLHGTVCLHDDKEPRWERLPQSRLTSAAYELFDPYMYGFGQTEYVNSPIYTAKYWAEVERFAAHLAAADRLSDELLVVLVSVGYGEGAHNMLMEHKSRQTALRVRLDRPRLRIRIILTAQTEQHLNIVLAHPLLARHLQEGSVEAGTLDLLDVGVPFRLTSGEVLQAAGQDMVFICTYVLEALPFQYIVYDPVTSSVEEAWIRCRENLTHALTMESDAGC
eukprot:TRINITY_DN52320_c0_g1_i2.p1 TRINITY_DN52320_c0_g1~~TRINITY_DN52320_c0_g1_i2.p1  ORF type:complete len:230 (+),score=24.58 TRINITY_DN52320_c0_g1_i2:77-766(+)